jgi:hypothetical protein
MERFERFHERMTRRAMARYLYGRAAVPPNAIGVEIKAGARWWLVTPGLPQDKAAWRVSHGDEHGPSGHDSFDVQGRPFESKYHAIYDVLSQNAWLHPRITGFVLPEKGTVAFRGFTNNPRRGIGRSARAVHLPRGR